MIYNFHLDYSDVVSLESDARVLQIIRDESVASSSFPISLIYQNNQDRQISLLTDREFTTPHADQPWVFHVENVISFGWETKGTQIRYRYHELATEDIFQFWLYHVVLPIYFSISQTYRFLHAGAVEVEGKPILFMAPSHGGKSTLTDYFLRRGHPLVTDDKMATFERDGEYFAVPSHPYHRPFRTVEVLGHLCDNAATQINPIHAIYILEKSEPDVPCIIRPLKGIEKFSRLHEGGEMNFSFFTPQYVSYLAALANKVAVFNITVPHDLERLEEVYQIIKNHTNSL
ncbi:hypothetical protein [Sulfuricurvum sp.]|uniref:hypothetical protein n=1 Tax=Sulfuricurvum sp. TaxID=2025608 RepID=UPI002623C9BB|nr:hypothetical protein [Sulfuricurvum sp.]MDD2781643.1 hypothetical protein [Sulfuricurvum sp.]